MVTTLRFRAKGGGDGSLLTTPNGAAAAGLGLTVVVDADVLVGERAEAPTEREAANVPMTFSDLETIVYEVA
jgi:hypothetical protein